MHHTLIYSSFLHILGVPSCLRATFLFYQHPHSTEVLCKMLRVECLLTHRIPQVFDFDRHSLYIRVTLHGVTRFHQLI